MSDQSEIEQIAAVWERLTGWLAEYAPASHASLLPPAAAGAVGAAEGRLTHELDFAFPPELKALWQMCGGVQDVEVPGNEGGALWAGKFLPGGIFLAPEAALWQRLRFGPGEDDPWDGADFVSFLDGEEASGAGECGMYVSYSTDPTLRGVGDWSTTTGPDLSPPAWPSVTTYLEAVCELLQTGGGPLLEQTGRRQPVLALGCLAWIDSDDGLEVPWRRVHPSLHPGRDPVSKTTGGTA
ncbi:hypothetical protein ABZV77_14390 [Streptomyces sp. NPDC004732]|uniref:hypothetical protein n=1 Tax=Streptomyces sp. NPDC004732 TaxID=3154290 RepID=UPI0033A1459E